MTLLERDCRDAGEDVQRENIHRDLWDRAKSGPRRRGRFGDAPAQKRQSGLGRDLDVI